MFCPLWNRKKTESLKIYDTLKRLFRENLIEDCVLKHLKGFDAYLFLEYHL
jgi:hypothetical protein